MSVGRPVLVHYHIFKNAGTSLDHALERWFGSRWRTFEGEHATDVVPAPRLRAFLEQNPDVDAVSSHLARPPLPWPECRPLVFLRHPLDRARSVFDFVVADRTQPTGDVARRLGFGGYLEWALGGAPEGVVIRNYQTVHLSDATFRDGGVLAARANRQDLEEAMGRLAEWPVVGVVDRYGESLQLFEHHYGSSFPGLTLSAVHINSTRAAPAPIDDEVARLRDELGPSLAERFDAANALDLALYAFACRRLTGARQSAGLAGTPTG